MRMARILKRLLLMNRLVSSGLEPERTHWVYMPLNFLIMLLLVSAEKWPQESVGLMCMARRLDRFCTAEVNGPNLCMARFFTAPGMVWPLTEQERPKERMNAPNISSRFSIFFSSRMIMMPGMSTGRQTVAANSIKGMSERAEQVVQAHHAQDGDDHGDHHHAVPLGEEPRLIFLAEGVPYIVLGHLR